MARSKKKKGKERKVCLLLAMRVGKRTIVVGPATRLSTRPSKKDRVHGNGEVPIARLPGCTPYLGRQYLSQEPDH